MGGHTVVVGYGTTGHAAVSALIDAGADAGDIVVVDENPVALDCAAQRGLRTVSGDATRSEILRRAGVPRAAAIVLATRRDETNAVIALKARDVATRIRVTASVEVTDNAAVLRRSGAAAVIVPEEAAGRLLAVAATAPEADEGAPLDLSRTVYGVRERAVRPEEVGRTPDALADVVLAVVRCGAPPGGDPGSPETIHEEDRILYLPRGRGRGGRS